MYSNLPLINQLQLNPAFDVIDHSDDNYLNYTVVRKKVDEVEVLTPETFHKKEQAAA